MECLLASTCRCIIHSTHIIHVHQSWAGLSYRSYCCHLFHHMCLSFLNNTIVDLDHGNCMKPLDLSSMQVVLWQTACVSLHNQSGPKRVAQYRVKTGTSWPSPKAAYFLPPQVVQMLFYVQVQYTMGTMHVCCLHSCMLPAITCFQGRQSSGLSEGSSRPCPLRPSVSPQCPLVCQSVCAYVYLGCRSPIGYVTGVYSTRCVQYTAILD